MPKRGWTAITIDDRTYRATTRLSQELRCSRAEVVRLALEQIDNYGDWGTVRVGDDVVVCRVGSPQWDTGSFRVVAAGGRECAEKSRVERLQYLTSNRR